MYEREREGERVAIVKEKSTDLYTVFPKTKHKLWHKHRKKTKNVTFLEHLTVCPLARLSVTCAKTKSTICIFFKFLNKYLKRKLSYR